MRNIMWNCIHCHRFYIRFHCVNLFWINNDFFLLFFNNLIICHWVFSSLRLWKITYFIINHIILILEVTVLIKSIELFECFKENFLIFFINFFHFMRKIFTIWSRVELFKIFWNYIILYWVKKLFFFVRFLLLHNIINYLIILNTHFK